MARRSSLWLQMAAVFVLTATGRLAAQEMQVTIIDRQVSNTAYSYVLPGQIDTSGTSNTYCSSFDYSLTCRQYGRSTATITPPRTRGYSVTGATLALKLTDGRIAIVNCDSKYALKFDYVNRRSCRIPLGNEVTASFRGSDALLSWSTSIDGRRRQSETYRILNVIDNPDRPAVARQDAYIGVAVLLREANIFESVAARTPLQLAAIGSRLGLIAVAGEWCEVEFKNSNGSIGHGYVRTADVRLDRQSTPVPSNGTPAADVSLDLDGSDRQPIQPPSSTPSVLTGTARVAVERPRLTPNGKGAMTLVLVRNRENAILEGLTLEVSYYRVADDGTEIPLLVASMEYPTVVIPREVVEFQIPHKLVVGIETATPRLSIKHRNGGVTIVE